MNNNPIGSKCAFVGCFGRALFRPVLLLKSDPQLQGIDAELSIGVCRECTKKKADKFLSDDGWKIIVGVFPKGFALPDRRFTGIRFEPLPRG